LLEITLVLWGVVVSLLVWSRTLGSKMVGHLLFQRAEPSKEDPYRDIAEEADELFEEIEGDFVGQERNLTEEGAMDAQCDNSECSEGMPDPVEETFEPPPVVSVAGAALDSLLLILVSLLECQVMRLLNSLLLSRRLFFQCFCLSEGQWRLHFHGRNGRTFGSFCPTQLVRHLEM
jgi:hypothetical protein